LEIWEAILLGIVQGLTEFLPVSSSGHLALMQNVFGIDIGQSNLVLDVLLHLGTLLAVFVAFWRDIVAVTVEFFRGIFALFSAEKRRRRWPPARRLVMLLIVATVPLIAAVFIEKYVSVLYDSTVFIGFALLVTGLMLSMADNTGKGTKDARYAKVSDGFKVGLAQLAAIAPGLSRSGITIATGVFCGFTREFAVRFSFLLSIPAVLGANILSIGDVVKSVAADGFSSALLWAYGAGVAAAAISGYFAIALVKKLMASGRFGGFAYYCYAVGLASLIYSLINALT